MSTKLATRRRTRAVNGKGRRVRPSARRGDSPAYVTFRMFSLTPTLDNALRKRAEEKGTTSNEVIREILTRELRA
jgi:hypothetical protein